MRLIDADDLKKAIDTIKHTALTCSDNEPLFDYVELPGLIKAIDNAPTVTPEKALIDKLKGGAEE